MHDAVKVQAPHVVARICLRMRGAQIWARLKTFFNAAQRVRKRAAAMRET